jgi:nucleotide-binding universal stress UspA family protein
MTEQARTQSVVVGIDGSQAALDAATWAVAEAVSRGVPLRLVHVSPATPPAHLHRRSRSSAWPMVWTPPSCG